MTKEIYFLWHMGLCAFVLLNTTFTALAAEPIKLRIASVGVPPSMHTLYMQVAYEEGIYRRNGLDVDELVQLAAGPLVTQALSAGQIDVAETDAEGVLNAARPAGFAAGRRVGAGPAPVLSRDRRAAGDQVAQGPGRQAVRDLAAGRAVAISDVPGARPRRHRAQCRDLGADRRRQRAAARAGQRPGQGRAAASRLRPRGATRRARSWRSTRWCAPIRTIRTSSWWCARSWPRSSPEAVTAVTRSIIEACRFMVTQPRAHHRDLPEIYRRDRHEARQRGL